MNTLRFTITNLTCEACVKVCTMILKRIPGVSDVSIDRKTGTAFLESSAPLDLDAIRYQLSKEHYQLAERT